MLNTHNIMMIGWTIEKLKIFNSIYILFPSLLILITVKGFDPKSKE